MTDCTEVGTDFDADFRIRLRLRYLTVCHRLSEYDQYELIVPPQTVRCQT